MDVDERPDGPARQYRVAFGYLTRREARRYVAAIITMQASFIGFCLAIVLPRAVMWVVLVAVMVAGVISTIVMHVTWGVLAARGAASVDTTSTVLTALFGWRTLDRDELAVAAGWPAGLMRWATRVALLAFAVFVVMSLVRQ